ncbi:MAG: alpha/beta hydrolase [Pseudomonadales bacterium]|nr:alpha/beta hydrolase [Pseudomonadales bacterium]
MRRIKRLGWAASLVIALYVALFIYAYWPTEPGVPAARLAQPEDRFVELPGIAVRYRRYGSADPTRPQILLIHGFANSLQSFRSLAPELANCCNVIAIDMPGYGLSDKPAKFDYHNGPQAAVMVAAARALGFDRPIYAGHSLGGAVALRATLQDQHARGLILMNPGILTTGVPKIAQLPVPPLPRLFAKQFGDRAFRERLLKRSYVDPSIVTPEVMDDVMIGSRTADYLAGETSVMSQYAEGEEIPLLKQVRVPTLVLWGDQDHNKLLSESTQLAAAIDGASLVHFPDAGHYVHEEAPAAVARAIERWLTTLPVNSLAAPAAEVPAVGGR